MTIRPRTGSVWTHMKTGSKYCVLGHCFDASNDTDGRIMVKYAPVGDRGHLAVQGCDEYSREISEFLEKFIAAPRGRA